MWQAPLIDEVVGEQVDSGMAGMDALLLERRTYDIFAAVRELHERHANIHVIGSLDFVQTLFAESLFDRLTLWVYPILLGSGKKVFADGVVPMNLRLVEPVVASPKGAVTLRYVLVDGTPGVGDMSAGDREG